jgi:uncharacterized membrane protein
LSGIVLLVYPAAVYYGLTRRGVRVVATILLALFAFNFVSGFVGARKDAEALRRTGVMMGAVTLLLVLAAIFEERRFILTMPVLINAVLLWGFAGSLRGPTSLVERFARIQNPDLSETEAEYCRTVTAVWSGFFILNGSVAAVTALFAPFSYWALYNGLIAYLLIAALASTEYVIRKYRFRRFGENILDRVLKKVLLPVIRNR